jgi:hypothetical protein
VVVDATETGELLPLSGASYTQGVEANESVLSSEPFCGQDTAFLFFLNRSSSPVSPPTFPTPPHTNYSLGGRSFESVWAYRRIFVPSSARAPLSKGISPGVSDSWLLFLGPGKRKFLVAGD